MGRHTILVGHSLENDLRSLKISHRKVVDTSVLFSHKHVKLSLKNLAFNYLKRKIQQGIHSSTEDAQITMGLAKLHVEVLSRLSKDNHTSFHRLNSHCQSSKVIIIDELHQTGEMLKNNVEFLEKTTP